jgi:hypothetical protein
MDPVEEARLAVLRLPPRTTKLPAPQNALLPVTSKHKHASSDSPKDEGDSGTLGAAVGRHASDTDTETGAGAAIRQQRQPRLHPYYSLVHWATSHLFLAQVDPWHVQDRV